MRCVVPTLACPIRAETGEVAGGPNVVGCSLFGIDASVVLHFDPEIALGANGTREMSCQSVASEYCSRAPSTQRATATAPRPANLVLRRLVTRSRSR